jgi:hypothetical protein
MRSFPLLNSTLSELVGGFYPVKLLVLILKRIATHTVSFSTVVCTVFLMAINIVTVTAAENNFQNQDSGVLLKVASKGASKEEPKVQVALTPSVPRYLLSG